MVEFREINFDSRDLAVTMEMKHKNLIRMINTQVLNLVDLGFSASDYFVETVYQDVNNNMRKNFIVSRKGRDLLYHRLTGEKGTVLSAQLIEEFHIMKDKKENLDEIELLEEEIRAENLEKERLKQIISLRDQEIALLEKTLKCKMKITKSKEKTKRSFEDDVPW